VVILARPELVLFDLDGTLVHTLPDLTAAVREVVAALRLPDVGEDAVARWVGNGMDRLLARALTRSMDGEPPPEQPRVAREVFLPAYERLNGQHSHVYAGVPETLAALRARGAVLAVVTNKPAAFTHALLARFDLQGHFASTVGGDSTSAKKPDPLPLQVAHEWAAPQAEVVLVVGDSRNDVLAARNAGYGVVATTYGYNHGEDIRASRPDAVVDALPELLTLLPTAPKEAP